MWDNPRTLNLAAGTLCGIALIVFAVAGIVLVLRSPLFPVSALELTHPLGKTTRHEIQAAAQAHVAGNFFAVSPIEVRSALEALPWVRRASVRRVWPDRLEVTLEEHVAFARWGEQALGLTLAAVGVASGLVQGFMIQPAIRRFGERTTLLAGLMFGAAGFAIYGLAETGAWFLAGIPVVALWGLAGASNMGIMSRLVGGSEQGQLQGANSSLMALASLFGPILFTLSFAWSITPGQAWHLPGAPFLLAALLLVAALALAWQVTRPEREPTRGSA